MLFKNSKYWFLKIKNKKRKWVEKELFNYPPFINILKSLARKSGLSSLLDS